MDAKTAGDDGGRLLTPARLAMVAFLLQAVMLNNWFPRIPDVQAKLGIGPGELAIALLGMPIGSFLSTMLAARIVERLTARRTIAFGFVAFGLMLMLPGWAPNVPVLFAILFLMGVTYVVMDVATNIEATRIQTALGRRILSTCHGFWSIGSMIGLVVGSAFAEQGVETHWHLIVVALAIVPFGVLTARRLPAFGRIVDATTQRSAAIVLPTLTMIPLCIFAFGVVIAELTTRNWGAVYLRDVLGATPAGTGVGFAAFSIGMIVFRLVGDGLADRFGAATLGRVCAGAAVAGVLMVVAAPNLAVAVVGFGLLGVGVSIGFPLAVSAAAALPERTPAANVASVSLIAYSSTLVGPPLVGFVAEAGGLRWGLAAILPVMILSAFFAGSLGRRRPRSEPPSPSVID